MELWIGVAIAGVIGFGLGALVMWWTDRKRGGGTSVATLKKEHEQFREQVTEHFVETAQRINRLTDSYKDLFDHLSQGAETLIDDASLRERMPRVSDQEVRLKRIGTRGPAVEANGPSSGKSTPTVSSAPTEAAAAGSTGPTSGARGGAVGSRPEATGKNDGKSDGKSDDRADAKPTPAPASSAKAGKPAD
ncbi:DUF1043 family protein [Wenzhouxiangella sp. XN79A]|uniref:YhcB family protein n=1 Tax=Wenzhouxiangella sp. XN79A TaxID=2724193 RepID=UPI00144A9008|nr:DUF1043 family protein [Wenzhouxiangella sp. XN79A]NKI35491.1 DUF1043 family protein [Wenzhouxiangella sp. XN79A]